MGLYLFFEMYEALVKLQLGMTLNNGLLAQLPIKGSF